MANVIPATPMAAAYSRNPLKAFFGHNQGRMPNIEEPQHPIHRLGRRYAPAGFGALDVGVMPRRKWIGTYGRRWKAHAFPGMADDTQPEFFNAAPEDQRIVGHFQGGEAYRLEGMHPQLPVIEGFLPDFRSRAFVHRKHAAADAVEEGRAGIRYGLVSTRCGAWHCDSSRRSSDSGQPGSGTWKR